MRFANRTSVMCGRASLRGAVAVACLALAPAAARAAYAPGCTVALGIAGTHEANAVALQADGKIVVGGYADSGGNRDFLVARFHPDLTLDTSFNGTGYQIDDLQGRDDEVLAIAVQFDQKIVVTGHSYKAGSQSNIAYARYNRDGSPDTSFNGSGYFLLDVSGGSMVEEMRGLAIQPDGKIVSVGHEDTSGQQFLAVRLTKTGGLDASFGSGGLAYPFLGVPSTGSGVTVDPDGGIVVVGEVTSDFFTLRLRPDGTLDPGFAGSGWTSLDVGAATVDSATSVVRQPDGKIVVAGTSSGNLAVARYNPNGALDATFGSGGVAVQNLGAAEVGSAVALDSAGKIVVAGESGARFAFARLLPGGGLDLSKIDDVSGLGDRSRGLAITRAGDLLLAGATQGASPKLTLALYNSDGTQDCGSFFLHPTTVALAELVPTGACVTHASCVNDQPGDAATGTPAAPDEAMSMVVSASSPARDLYELADGQLPAGKVVTEIEVVAQVAWSGSGASPSARLVYERQGFDAAPVSSATLSVPSTSFSSRTFLAPNLSWSAAELDALEIGIDHASGSNLRMTQAYLKVTYGDALVRPVQAFTASASGDAANGQVMLDWLNPSYGLYDETVIRRVPTCPALPGDGVVVASVSGGLGQTGTFVDTVPIGPTYHYAAFVEDAEDHASAGVCVAATPFDRTAEKVDWIYETGIAALATPGLRIDGAGMKSVVYTVANDGLIHAVGGGPVAVGGGRWPATWKPFRLGDASQARPPVVPLPSGALALLAGSQDGHVYAVNAVTGALLWRSPRLGAMVQAAPAAVLSAYGGGDDLVFAGTRNAGGPNRLYALDPTDGSVVWYFDNGGAPNGIGMIVSGPSVDYGSGRVYFTSAAGTSGNTVWCLDYSAASPPQPCWGSFGIATGGGDVEASPVLFNGSIFVSESTSGGDLFAVAPATGSTSLVASLAGGGAKGFVFPRFGTFDVFAGTSTTVWSIDTATPSTNWSGACVATPSTPTAPPFTDRVFVGSGEGKLFQMSASSGSGCPTPPNVCIGDCASTIVGAPGYDVLNMMLYAGTDEGRIYGVRTPF